MPLDRAEERVPFALDLPAEQTLGKLARLGACLATGGEMELLEPLSDFAEFAPAGVVDVLMGRLDSAESMLAEGDDLGSVAAAELAVCRGDHLLEPARPIGLVPSDEAAGMDGDVEGMLELAEARRCLAARARGQREQARMQVLVVERLPDQQIGERLRAELASRSPSSLRVGAAAESPTSCPCRSQASPTATQCLQKRPSRPTGHVQEPASSPPPCSSRTR